MSKSPKVVALPKIRNSHDARERVAELANNLTSSVFFSEHCENRMIQRDIARIQVMRVLRAGILVHDAVWDTEKERGWKLRLKRITAGVEIEVVAKLIERDDDVVVVLTTFHTN